MDIPFKIYITMFKTFQIQAALNLDNLIKHNREKMIIPKQLESIEKEYGKDSKEFEKYLDKTGIYFFLLRDYIIGDAINCVIYSAYAIETYINTYLSSNLSKNKFKDIERKPITERIKYGYNQITGDVFPNDLLDKIRLLFKRRNSIAHFKPTYEDVEIKTENASLTEKEIMASMEAKSDEELFGVPFNVEVLRDYVFLLDRIKTIMPLNNI